MDYIAMENLCIGDKIEWTGENPDRFEVINIFKGNPMSQRYAYTDWCWRLKSLTDGHSELISGYDMENVHFIKKN